MNQTQDSTLTQIEGLIDSIGLSQTLELVASICFDKAEHIKREPLW